MNLDEQQFLRRLGLCLRERREALNLTQEQLASKCQLHRTFVGSVERGERNVSILNLRVMANHLRVSLAELFESASVTGHTRQRSPRRKQPKP